VCTCKVRLKQSILEDRPAEQVWGYYPSSTLSSTVLLTELPPAHSPQLSRGRSLHWQIQFLPPTATLHAYQPHAPHQEVAGSTNTSFHPSSYPQSPTAPSQSADRITHELWHKPEKSHDNVTSITASWREVSMYQCMLDITATVGGYQFYADTTTSQTQRISGASPAAGGTPGCRSVCTAISCAL
jgi:hypothetical protein